MPNTPRLTAEGWTYAAPNPHTGRWHVVVDDRAACSAHVALNLDALVTVGRAPARTRCKQRACANRWQSRISETTRQREARQREYAEHALNELSWTRRRSDNHAMWEQQGWLNSHYVYVLRYSHLKVHRIGFTAKLGDVEKMRHRAGDPALVDLAKVPNRHAAIVLQLEVLERVEQFRRELPPAKMPTGGTKIWSTTAPAVALSDVAAALELS